MGWFRRLTGREHNPVVVALESARHPNPRSEADDEYWESLQGAALPHAFNRRKAAEVCRRLYQRNPMARRALRLDLDYVVGSSMEVTLELDGTPDGQQRDEERINARLRRACREMGMTPTWWRRLFLRLYTDGEVAVQVVDRGEMGLRGLTLWDECVSWKVVWDSETRAPVALREYQSGIQKLYRILNTDAPEGAWEAVLADPSVGGADSGEVFWFRHDWVGDRGTPELLAVANRATWEGEITKLIIERAKSLLRWFWHFRVEGAGEEDIRAKQQEFREAPPSGSVFWTDDATEIKSQSVNLAAYDTAALQKWLRGTIAGGAGHPAHWYGQGDDANLATASAMSEPTYRMLASFQASAQEIIEELYWWVLAQLVEGGRLEPLDRSEIHWSVSFPRLDSRDYTRATASWQQSTQSLMLQLEAGLISHKCAQRLNAEITRRLFDVSITPDDFGEEPEANPLLQLPRTDDDEERAPRGQAE